MQKEEKPNEFTFYFDAFYIHFIFRVVLFTVCYWTVHVMKVFIPLKLPKWLKSGSTKPGIYTSSDTTNDFSSHTCQNINMLNKSHYYILKADDKPTIPGDPVIKASICSVSMKWYDC